MKRIITCLFAIFIITHLKAQQLELGVKAGISSNTIGISDLQGLDLSTERNSTYNFGIYGRLKVIGLGLYVQPELIYNTRASNFTLNSPTLNEPTIFAHKAHYVDVPVLVGWKFLGLLRVYAGPNFQFLLSQDTNIPEVTGNTLTQENLKDRTTGVQIGVGADFLKIRVDLKYDFNTSDMGSAFSFNGMKPTINNNMLMFQVGIKLFSLL